MLAKNTIYWGDCEQVISQMPEGFIQLVFTSPPYNLGDKVKYDIYKDSKPFDEYVDWLDRIFTGCIKALSPGGHLAIQIANTGRDPYLPITDHLAVRLSRKIKMVGEIIWDKQNIHSATAWGSWRSANKPSLRDHHEYVLVFRKDGERKGKSDITRDEFIQYTDGLWNIKAETRSKWQHPAAFPEALARRIIKLYSFPGETVFDPFMGSGTTGLVAQQLGRQWVGCEISENYVNIATDRIEQEGTLLPVEPEPDKLVSLDPEAAKVLDEEFWNII